MNFDRVASVYQWLEKLVYGGALQRARVEFLGDVSAGRVLILGDGDGRFLEVLLREMGEVEVDVVEASGRMIELASRRVGGDARVNFHRVAVEEFDAVGEYDLVVSHFFLDCFGEGEIGAIVGRVGGWLRDGGSWLVSDFQVPASGFFRRLRARVLLWVMYRFFGVCCGLGARRLVDPGEFFEGAGMVLVERRVSDAGFLRADWWRVDGLRRGGA